MVCLTANLIHCKEDIVVVFYTQILEVNLFAYRLFHEDFSSVDGALYKSSPSSTVPRVIPEQIWIIYKIYI